MTSDQVNWKDAFRQVVEGITPSSKFVLVKEFTKPRGISIEFIRPGKRGFYAFYQDASQRERIMRIDYRGGMTEVGEFLYSRRLKYTEDGCLVVEKVNEDVWLNIDTEVQGVIQPRFPPETMHVLEQLGIGAAGVQEISQYRCTPGNKSLVYHPWYAQTWIVNTFTRTKSKVDHKSGTTWHLYRDVLYNSSVGISPWSRWVVHEDIKFSGMHCIHVSWDTGCLFVYNLEKKVYTCLDVSTLEVRTDPGSPRSLVFNSVEFSSDDGVLYILASLQGKYRLITHR